MNSRDISSSDYRITDNNSGLFTRITDGDHSQTQMEFETMQKIKMYLSRKMFNGEELIKNNNEGWKYYLVEDGTIFKKNEDYHFYRLDLNKFQWVHDQSLISLYYDSFLKFKELLNFEDYYEISNSDLNKGRHL